MKRLSLALILLLVPACSGTGVTVKDVARMTCYGVRRLHEACVTAGLDENEPCPVDTAGGE